MKRVFYASGSVLTGDRTAEALVHYAELLAVRESSDTADIPIRLDDGTTARAQFLIGPASQLAVVPVEGDEEGPDDEDTIAELGRRARALSSPHPQAVDEPPSPYYAEGDNFSDSLG
jgi:hypothetical protein